MSVSVSQAQLEERILVSFYEHAQKSGARLTAESVSRSLNGSFGMQRIELALEELSSGSLIEGSYSTYEDTTYVITNKGHKVVEEVYLNRSKETEESRENQDPVLGLEAKLAPASGRMVSFGDNLANKADAIASVEQAEDIIRSSNTLDPELKEDTSKSLLSWRDLVSSTRSFSVGAFKFLVWDRVRSAIEGAIEDAYKYMLIGILITLGALIVSLF